MKTLILSALLACAPALAGDMHEHPKAKPASAELQQIKGLVGDWKGTAEMGGKKIDVATSFKLTANGSAVVETLGAGTPHEMTNVYHDVDGQLTMTHYCAVGNAPVMKVTKSDGKTLSLAAVAANGIDPKKTPHMHSLTYSFPAKDKMTATWASANMGPENEKPSTFEYTRR